jgi:hypothetical protein
MKLLFSKASIASSRPHLFLFSFSFFVIEMECHDGRTDDRLQLQTLLKSARACVCLFVLCVVCARVCIHAKLSVARALHLIRNTWRSNTWAAAVLILPREPRPQPLKNTTPHVGGCAAVAELKGPIGQQRKKERKRRQEKECAVDLRVCTK